MCKDTSFPDNNQENREKKDIASQDPAIKVMELGMRVGFSTPKYFTKVFKEEFGMSPSEYLEKLKGES